MLLYIRNLYDECLTPVFEYKITIWICVLVLWIHKEYIVVKNLLKCSYWSFLFSKILYLLFKVWKISNFRWDEIWEWILPNLSGESILTKTRMKVVIGFMILFFLLDNKPKKMIFKQANMMMTLCDLQWLFRPCFMFLDFC